MKSNDIILRKTLRGLRKLLMKFLHRRPSVAVPFTQWPPEALGADFILPFAPTNSGRFLLRRTAHWTDASFVCLDNANVAR